MDFKYRPEVELGYPDESTPYVADDEEALRRWQRLYLQRWLENLEQAASRPTTIEDLRLIVWELLHVMRRLSEWQGWELTTSPPAPAAPLPATPSARRRGWRLGLPRLR